jgi:cell division protein FtsQ
LRIDPRFARRRTEVQRQAGRRRLHILIVVVSVLALLGLAAGSLYTPLLSVHRYVVMPGSPPAAEVLAAAGVHGHPPMLDVDTAALAARLDRQPDLGGARVTRQWPSTVRLSVEARTAVAVVADGSQWATVDATGRVLSVSSASALGLPVIDHAGLVPAVGGWLAGTPGPSARPQVAGGPTVAALMAAPASSAVPTGLAGALAVAANLPAALRPEMLTVSVRSGGTLTASVLPATVASGSITVVFGAASDLGQKLTSLATLLTEINLSGVTTIDLTVPDRPAVS